MKHLFLLSSLLLSTSVFAGPGDTLGVSLGSTPIFAPNNEVSIVPYAGGYAYGVNFDPTNNFIGIAQGYINEDPNEFIGVLSFIPKKQKGASNTPNTKLTFRLYNMTPTGASQIVPPSTLNPVEGPSGQALATKEYFYDEIDTNLLAYNVVMFDTPVLAPGNIAVAVDLSNVKAAGDIVGFMSDNVGNAFGINYAFHQANAGGTIGWYTSNSVFQGALDNNIAIFPMVKPAEQPSGFSQANFMGVKTNVYPNPSNDILFLDLEMTKSDKVTIRLMDISGKVIRDLSNLNQGSGKNTHAIDVSGLSSGAYILLVEGSNGERIARQVVLGEN
jgi:hypothetical protein